MNKLVKWSLFGAMLIVTLVSAFGIVSAATFTDSFDVAGDGNWSLDTTFNEDLIEGSIGPNIATGASIYQNFSATEGMSFTDSISITADLYTLAGSNVHYNVISFIQEGAWNSQVNGVFLWPTYDIDDNYNNHEMRIACLGSCSCTLVDYPTEDVNDGFYSVSIDINLTTGNVTMVRNDSKTLSTIVTGCDFQNFYTNLFFRSSYDVTEFWDFSITDNAACVPNWTCSGYGSCNSSNLQVCNAVTDQNVCGGVYGGDYSEFSSQACIYLEPYLNYTFEAVDFPTINDVSPQGLDGYAYSGWIVPSGFTGDGYFSEGRPQNASNFLVTGIDGAWVSSAENYTISTMFKLDQLYNDGEGNGIMGDLNAAAGGSGLAIHSVDGYLILFLQQQAYDTTYYPDSGDWNMYTMTYLYESGVGNLSLYVNGSYIISATNAGNSGDYNWTIGSIFPSVLYSNQGINGTFDDVLFYRETLSESAVADLYNLYNSNICTPNWTCSGYGLCESGFLQCDAAIDQNTCGESYSGNYSEFAPVACDLEQNLEAYYKMDEASSTDGLVDELGAHNFAIVGTVASVPAAINNGRGTYTPTDYFNASNWFINQNAEYSFSVWVKMLGDATQPICAGNEDLLVVYDGVAGMGAEFTYECSNARFNFYTASGSFAHNYAPATNELMHLVYTHDLNGTEKIYFNGTLVETGTNSMPDIMPTDLYIGSSFAGTSEDFALDEIGLWSRTLSPDEIVLLYNSGDGLPYEYFPCQPNWSCIGYAVCNSSDLQVCNNVTDLNTCGILYSGDYSEFTPQACDFCLPNWTCSGYGSCLTNDTKLCNSTLDNNTCYAQTSLPSDLYNGTYTEFSYLICDYCLPNWSCSLFGTCNISNLKPCLAVNDSNVCYTLTGLSSDQFNQTLPDYEGVCTYVPPAPSGGGGSFSTYLESAGTRATDLVADTRATTTGWWDGLSSQEKQVYILVFSGFAIAFLLRGKFI
jgi:hypothetical protein